MLLMLHKIKPMKLQKILTALLSIILLLTSCASSKQVQQPAPAQSTTTIVTVKETVHDTLLVTKTDTVLYTASLAVDNKGNVHLQQPKILHSNAAIKPIAKAPTVTIKDNKLVVKCECDSSAIYFSWKQKDTTTQVKEVLELPAKIIEKPFSFWQKTQLWLGRILIIIGLIIMALCILKWQNLLP
jgi:hypothetical protein